MWCEAAQSRLCWSYAPQPADSQPWIVSPVCTANTWFVHWVYYLVILCAVFIYRAAGPFSFEGNEKGAARPGLICTETSGPFWIILSICHDAALLDTLLCGGEWDQCAWLHVCVIMILHLMLTGWNHRCVYNHGSRDSHHLSSSMQELTAASGSLQGGRTDEGDDWQMMPSRHYLDMTWRVDVVWVISREYINIC